MQVCVVLDWIQSMKEHNTSFFENADDLSQVIIPRITENTTISFSQTWVTSSFQKLLSLNRHLNKVISTEKVMFSSLTSLFEIVSYVLLSLSSLPSHDLPFAQCSGLAYPMSSFLNYDYQTESNWSWLLSLHQMKLYQSAQSPLLQLQYGAKQMCWFLLKKMRSFSLLSHLRWYCQFVIRSVGWKIGVPPSCSTHEGWLQDHSVWERQIMEWRRHREAAIPN